MGLKPIIITAGAIGRRFLTLLIAAIVTYASDVWPELLKKALLENPKTVVLIPLVFLIVEAIQKYLRERKKALAARY